MYRYFQNYTIINVSLYPDPVNRVVTSSITLKVSKLILQIIIICIIIVYKMFT